MGKTEPIDGVSTRLPGTRWERLGVTSSLLVFLVGLTDLATGIDIAPMWVYLAVLWVVAFVLWIDTRFLN